MNNRIYINRDWQFVSNFSDNLSQWETAEYVTLPHTTAEVPLHYFDESSYQMLCAYRKMITAEPEWSGKRIFLTIEAAGHSSWVYLNGEEIGEHHCGYTAYTVELKNLRLNQENELMIKVDSREQQNIPPFGHVIDYMTFGGLYREVYLEVREQCYIADVFAKTNRIDSDTYLLKSKIKVVGESCKCKQMLLDINRNVIEEYKAEEFEHRVCHIKEWAPEHPHLYILRTELYREGEFMDSLECRIGFREAVFQKDGFYLNGSKYKIRGLNRHQSYPYVGYAMPKSMQCLDADILKNELGCNAVRTSHYPQSQYFIDRCDEIGLLVFTEMPGWQHIGDMEWKKQAVCNVRDMVVQYRNHPSVILWGVRINESPDDDSFYKKTNEVAHRFDSTRQTSGVRCIQKSHLLEDVYAYNDFSHEGNNAGCVSKQQTTSDMSKGYFISEYNGHMYPTKSYDTEGHRVEHMLRHARVIDAYYGEEDIAGGFGWCMFDYNTHKDFGSGDRVCYHGVMDMFRNPKLAASVYASQQNERDILEISSNMDIGEQPACLMKDVYAITNADSVRLYKNNLFIREFNRENEPFSNMPNSVIAIDDFIGDRLIIEKNFSKEKSDAIKTILMDASKNGLGNLPFKTKALAAKCILRWGMKMQDAVNLYNEYIGNWGGTATEYRFEAVKDGKVVKTVTKKPFFKGHLHIECSNQTLHEDTTYDVALVRIQAMDEYDNLMNFASEPLHLEVTGAVALIGPKLISLEGGMAGTYVKTTGKTGKATLHIHSAEWGNQNIEFEII